MQAKNAIFGQIEGAFDPKWYFKGSYGQFDLDTKDEQVVATSCREFPSGWTRAINSSEKEKRSKK